MANLYINDIVTLSFTIDLCEVSKITKIPETVISSSDKKDLKNLDQWYEKIKTRPAYKKAIYDWGDVTADQRAQNGKDAYPKIKEYWDKA